MVPRLPICILGLLLIATFLSGCGQQAAPPLPETPVTTATPPATAPPTTPVPPTTAPPEPFPGALTLGTPYRYGREDIAMEVTVSRVKVADGYEWYSPDWGRYYSTTPKEGNQFLFAFVRLIDRGTARARLPSGSKFILHGDGNSYVQNVDRDHDLLIKGISVKQYDYYFDNTAGWIDPAESNKVEGFLLYEVPATLAPERAYLEVTFSSNASAVWKLG